MALQRLQKILAQAGVSSRRSAERLITEGRVRVNGRIISELGARANPLRDRVEVDGKRLVAERSVYYLMHKPRGVVTTLDDPEGRKSVKDLLRGISERVFPVGRLDFQTSGALLLTNDGAMAQALLHPTRHVPKVYHAKIQGTLDSQRLDLLRAGVTLDDGEHTAPADVDIVRKDDKHTFIEVTISEGKNRQVHRMLDAVGRVVLRLTRLAFAELAIEGLRPGELRQLTPPELTDLKEKYLTPSKKVRGAKGADPVGLPAEDDADVSHARGADRGKRKPSAARERMRPYVGGVRGAGEGSERKRGFAGPVRGVRRDVSDARERKDGFVSPARRERQGVDDASDRKRAFVTPARDENDVREARREYLGPARGERRDEADARGGKRGFASPARGERRDENDARGGKRGFAAPARGERRDEADARGGKGGFVSPARGERRDETDARGGKRGFVSRARGDQRGANAGFERKRGFVPPARGEGDHANDARRGKRGSVSSTRGERQTGGDVVEGKRSFVSPARGDRRDANETLDRKRGFVSPARGTRQNADDSVRGKREFVSPARGSRRDVNDAREGKRGFATPARGGRQKPKRRA